MSARRMEIQTAASESLQQQPSAYLGTPLQPTNVLERIPEDSATHDSALSPQDLFPGRFHLPHVMLEKETPERGHLCSKVLCLII